MAMYSKTPVYNLKAVLQETGLKADVLRAWERRYGLPNPGRTDGGHRLYSDHDVALIKWLIKRQAEGLSISRAAGLWNESAAAGTDLLGQTEPVHQAEDEVFTIPNGSSQLSDLRDAWLASSLAFNEQSAENYLNQAFSMYPAELVCIEVLQKGISEVGRLWHIGEVTVQQEHYITAMAQRRIDAILLASPSPTRMHTIIVGCPANEWHSFTPLMITLFLRRRGYNVIYLGPNVPTERFIESMTQIKPSLVILSAQMLNSAAEMMPLASALVGAGIHVGFGGRVFNYQPSIRQCIPGDFLGETLELAINKVDQLLFSGSIEEHNACCPSPEYAAAHQDFVNNRAALDTYLIASLSGTGRLTRTNLDQSNIFTGDAIAAALALGNLDLLIYELEWLKALLRSHQLPIELIPFYMGAYGEAVRKILPQSTWIISDWILQKKFINSIEVV